MSIEKTLKPDGYSPERAHLVLSSAALGVLSLALPVMTLQIYDRILPNPDSGTLPVLMAGVAVAVLLEACLRLARAWMIGWNGAVYEHAVSEAAMKHVLAADVSKVGPYGIGEFLNRLTAVSKLKDFYSGYVLMTVTELAFVPLYLGVIFYIARDLAVIPLALLLAFSGISLVQGRKMRDALAQRDAVDDERYDFLIDCLKGIHTVKAFAIEELLARRYESLQEKSGRASFEASEASTSTFNAGTTLSHLMMAVVMTVGAIMAMQGHITTGALIATLQLSGRLMQPVQRALVLWAKYQDFALARKKVRSVFALPVHKPVAAVAELPQPGGRLSVRNLNYGTQLRDVSFDLSLGEAMVIGGAAGAGKTELLEMLSGLYSPESGEILVDGVDIAQYPPEELVRHVGYLATEGVIFRGTIRDNITRFGAVPEADAQQVAAMLGVDRDVARLSGGFDTMLQADGADEVTLGLRQRISMARVLASRPRILLFDEADRALDRAGYNLVFSLLARLGRKTAMIIVSDDANLTALGTSHYTLQDGRLIGKTDTTVRRTAP